MCEFDFSEAVSPDSCITSIKLLFGKELHHKHHIDHEDSAPRKSGFLKK